MNLALFLVDGELISSIKEGLCVFVGIGRDDTKKDTEYMLVLDELYYLCSINYHI
jgi:D-Tyr-tRNAtyr deacylase